MLFSDLQHGPTETLVTELRDYPQWHRGRTRYGVWVIPVTDPALLEYIESARVSLLDLLHPDSLRQAHLTVFVCGFEQEVCVADDDFSPQQLQTQMSALQQDPGMPCMLPLMAPDSFASAAFIPVADPQGRLALWRNALELGVQEVRQAAYTPHITLGLYRRSVTAEIVRQRLKQIEAPPISLRVDALHYVTYDARQQFGPLQNQCRLVLGT